jgi:hypothetical protein
MSTGARYEGVSISMAADAEAASLIVEPQYGNDPTTYSEVCFQSRFFLTSRFEIRNGTS